MKPRHAIPLPRKRAAEKGRAGVDRPPMRLYRTAPTYCPRHAIWVGAGSSFGNPFPIDGALINAAAEFIRYPQRREFNAVVQRYEAAFPTPQERAAARAWLYKRWRAGVLLDERGLPRRFGYVRGLLARMLEENNLPEPPTDIAIRTALRGRDLIDSTPDRWPSHADELLSIANATLPGDTP